MVYTTQNNGDDWGMVYGIAIPTLLTSYQWHPVAVSAGHVARWMWQGPGRVQLNASCMDPGARLDGFLWGNVGNVKI